MPVIDFGWMMTIGNYTFASVLYQMDFIDFPAPWYWSLCSLPEHAIGVLLHDGTRSFNGDDGCGKGYLLVNRPTYQSGDRCTLAFVQFYIFSGVGCAQQYGPQLQVDGSNKSIY